MPSMSYDRHCAEIVAQAALLTSRLADADLAAPVPTCPGWNLAHLLRHLGGAHRWVETIVRTRASEPVSDEQVNNVSSATDEDPAALGAWLTKGAEQLADTLREAGPETAVWTVAPGGTPVFWARRMVHETVVHRADVTFAVDASSSARQGPAGGAEFGVAADVAADALDEWLSFGPLPEVFEAGPELRTLMSGGRTLSFRATDLVQQPEAARANGPQNAAEWLVGFDGDALTWRRGHAEADVTVRGPLADLVLFVYGRCTARGFADGPGRVRGPGGDRVEVLGDAALLRAWLDATSFWLKE
ncbi:maleylpyruvate isomerase N-terminal domain-containing protein [Streptomyces sp. NPDC048506]|uniref:maleylpyruvate isomerase N-terminal domain-containing protein n=1 Tax=Streptomyces sp. NPDC048506 TaxID=3155028 RepID=UPI00344AC7D7